MILLAITQNLSSIGMSLILLILIQTALVHVCVCGGKKKLAKSFEDERLIKFLMGLNDTYAHARSNILMIKPLLTVNHVYSLLFQDQNQRETPTYNQFSSGG